jgi:ApbE superfamily uncharacterized protein (UPF0280 family)
MYQPRTYRHWVSSPDLVSFSVVVGETDLHISASGDLTEEARRLIIKYRGLLEGYIKEQPSFLSALEPLAAARGAPSIVKEMVRAARQTGVGPMAAVAGAIAQYVGAELLELSPELIVENGGDIFLRSKRERVVAIYAGGSSLSGKIGLRIKGAATPLGVCTSSGTVGHSLSFGRADAVVAVARSAILADAAATAIGNRVKTVEDIAEGLEYARGIGGLKGAVIILGEKFGAWGDVNICRL